MRLLYFLTAIVLFACNNPSKPELVFSSETIKIDSLAPDTEQTIKFTIYNKGTRDLIVYDYMSSCECTILDLKPNTKLKANDSLPVQMNIRGYQSDSGKWKQIICTFRSNCDSTFKHLPIEMYTKQIELKHS